LNYTVQKAFPITTVGTGEGECCEVVTMDLRPFSVLNGHGMMHYGQTLIDIRAKYGKQMVHKLLKTSLENLAIKSSVLIIDIC